MFWLVLRLTIDKHTICGNGVVILFGFGFSCLPFYASFGDILSLISMTSIVIYLYEIWTTCPISKTTILRWWIFYFKVGIVVEFHITSLTRDESTYVGSGSM